MVSVVQHYFKDNLGQKKQESNETIFKLSCEPSQKTQMNHDNFSR